MEDDDANVLCLGARIVGPELINELVRAYISAGFSGAERHVRRLLKMLKTSGRPRGNSRSARAQFATLQDFPAPSCANAAAHVVRCVFVEPEVVVEVAFNEWTRDGTLRQPSYKGQRIDKNPRDVVREER